MKYHSFQLESERITKLVIRGLPHNVNPEHIRTELANLGHDISKVAPIKNYRTGQPFPLYIFDTPIENNSIFSVRKIAGIDVEIEKYRGNKNFLHAAKSFIRNVLQPPSLRLLRGGPRN